MKISLIVAMDRNRGIGFKGKLPWHLSSDLKRFKALTMGHALIMGRKTYESIGRPLPGREMIVVSRNPEYQADGCVMMPSLEQALEFVKQRGDSEVFVIGGGDIFRQALPRADCIYLTLVDTESQADTYFPDLNPEEWVEIESERVSTLKGDDYGYVFKVLHRKPDTKVIVNQ